MKKNVKRETKKKAKRETKKNEDGAEDEPDAHL